MKLNVFFMTILSCAMRNLWCDITFPDEVQVLVSSLKNNKNVACICVDGIISGEYGWPQNSCCAQLKPEVLKKDETVIAWVNAFTECRSREHHELFRSIEWMLVPCIGGMFGYRCLQRYSKTVQLSATAFAAWCAYLWNKQYGQVVDNFFDHRADAAAVKVCPTAAEKKIVIDYLEEQQKSQPVGPEQKPEYHLFSINAYDTTQSNMCSFFTINIKFPMTWLFSSDKQDKVQQRIAYLKNAL